MSEAMCSVQVDTPPDFLGEVIRDLSERRGRVEGQETVGDGLLRLTATVPVAEMSEFTADLHSITEGRGEFAVRFGEGAFYAR